MSKQERGTLAALLESFFRQRLANQRLASPATIAAYRDTLRMLLLFISARVGRPPAALSLEDLDRDNILAFLDDLERTRGNSIRTRNARLAAIRSFFAYASIRDPAAAGLAQRILSIEGKRCVKRAVDYLRPEELAAILDAPDRSSRLGRRDYALLLFLARTGARVSEAIGVNAADLRLTRPTQVKLYGKGMKVRVVPLSPDLAEALHEACRELGLADKDDKPLFVNARGRRLTRFGVTHLLRRSVEKAADSFPPLAKRRVSPHTFRHTLAMQLLQAGVDLTTIRSWLGHVGVETTHCYVEADLEMKRQALDKCSLSASAPALYQPTDKVLALLESL